MISESHGSFAFYRSNLDSEQIAKESLEARIFALEQKELDATAREKRRLVITGYVHFDWVAFRQSSQDELTQDLVPLNEDRFLIRRARIRAARDFGLFHGAFEIDGNTTSGLQLRPINAEMSLKWPATRSYAETPWSVDPSGDGDWRDTPWFMVSAGIFRTPFGYEVQESERRRFWLERSTMSNALFPQSFDLGVRLEGGYSFLRYQIGIMNGDPIGERQFPGRDPNKSKDFTFRVGGATEVTTGIRLEAGMSGLTGRGFSPGQTATKDTIQWQDGNDDGVVDSGEIHIRSGSPATPSQSFKRFAIGADLRASARIPILGELAVRGEVVGSQNLDRGVRISDPIAAKRDLRQLGWYVGFSQELTPWAMVGVRYDHYHPDADAREQAPVAIVPSDPSLSTWSFTASARSNGMRLTGQYDHRINSLGRDASGAPAQLADDSFTLRAEMRF